MIPAVWLLLVAPIFIPCSQPSLYLSFAHLGRMKPKWDLHAVPQKAGEAGCSPHSSFPGEKNSLWLEYFLLILSKADLGDWDEVVFLFILCSYYWVFCSTVLLKFLQQTPELFLFRDSCQIVDLWGMMQLGPPTSPFRAKIPAFKLIDKLLLAKYLLSYLRMTQEHFFL